MLANVLDAVAPTLREIAREAGISYEAIRSYRKGLRTPPAPVIRRLAAVLHARGGKLRTLAAQLREKL